MMIPEYVDQIVHLEMPKADLEEANKALTMAPYKPDFPQSLQDVIKRYLDGQHKLWSMLSFVERCNAYGWRPHHDGLTGNLIGLSPKISNPPHADIIFRVIVQSGTEEEERQKKILAMLNEINEEHPGTCVDKTAEEVLAILLISANRRKEIALRLTTGDVSIGCLADSTDNWEVAYKDYRLAYLLRDLGVLPDMATTLDELAEEGKEEDKKPVKVEITISLSVFDEERLRQFMQKQYAQHSEEEKMNSGIEHLVLDTFTYYSCNPPLEELGIEIDDTDADLVDGID